MLERRNIPESQTHTPFRKCCRCLSWQLQRIRKHLPTKVLYIFSIRTVISHFLGKKTILNVIWHAGHLTVRAAEFRDSDVLGDCWWSPVWISIRSL